MKYYYNSTNMLVCSMDGNIPDGEIEISIGNLDYGDICANPNKYQKKDNQLIDISDTDEYKAKIAEDEKVLKTSNLTAQIESIDKKRIRAISEPTIKDESTGQTWLEYYTEQIKTLRTQIAAL